MCKETGYEGICINNIITRQVCVNDFINCDSMTKTENKTDECTEELHQDAALNSAVNTPETTDSKIFKTFKIDKTSSNVPKAITHSKNTKHKITKLQTYEAKLMKRVFNDTPSEFASDDFYKTKKKKVKISW